MHPDEVMAALDHPQAPRPVHKAVHTGSLGLDLALGGGWPAGRIAELHGLPGAGKTTMAYHAAAQAQKTGTVLWVQAGSMFDIWQARNAGVNLANLVCYAPEDTADALKAMEIAATGADKPSLIVMDTATGLEEGGDYGAGLGRLSRALKRDGPPVLFVSNDRVSEAMTGGFSTLLRAVAPVRVRFARHDRLTRAEVVKNNGTPPATHLVRFRIDQGYLDWADELVRLGLDCGVLHNRGSWICSGEVALGQGVANAAVTLRTFAQHDYDRLLGIREQVIKCLT